MSQSGKQFLSGLMNRVFRANKESRGAAQRRERSLSARRLGMEPLEERQLLAVDPTLSAVAEAANVAQNDVVGPTLLVDLTDLAAVAAPGAGSASVSVSNGSFEETTLVSQSEKFQITVGPQRLVEISAAPAISTETQRADAYLPSVSLSIGYGEMGWAATMANMLAKAGWGDVKDVVVDPNESVERQVFQYFTDNFTNAQSSLLYAYAWYMNGLELANGFGWAEPYGDGGNLFPTETGEFKPYDSYCAEFFASDFDSPLTYLKNNFLAKDDYVAGLEIRYYDELGDETYSTGEKSWLTIWGVETDDNIYDEEGNVVGTYAANDPRRCKAVHVSDPNTGSVEQYAVTWNEARSVYVLEDYNPSNSPTSFRGTPYIYSFTTIEKMPGYGQEATDAYERNDSAADVDQNANVETNPDLGKIDGVDADYNETGAVAKGNDTILNNLRLDAQTDKVDFYRFELTQTASNADAIVLDYTVGQINSAIKATLMKCGEDGSILALDPTDYGFVAGRFDANLETVVKYSTDPETQKTYRSNVYRETIKLAGLPAGKYYLKVDFVDQTVPNAVNENYTLSFHAGYDDVYETNDAFEDLAQNASHPANLGFVDETLKEDDEYAVLEIGDLVLKQYDRNETSEADWFSFETLSAGVKINLLYQSTWNLENDGDLDMYLYRADDTDPRGYSLIAKSGDYNLADQREIIDLTGENDLSDVPPGKYYLKVVGFKGAGNIHYKLSIASKASTQSDARFEIPSDGSSWRAPLVVSNSPATTGESIATLGERDSAYLNFNVSAYVPKNSDGVKTTLALFINGKRVSDADVETILAKNAANAQLSALFGDGYVFTETGSLRVDAFNLGKIEDFAYEVDGKVYNKYFNVEPNAVNSIVLVVNPENYEFGEGFGEASQTEDGVQIALDYQAVAGDEYNVDNNFATAYFAYNSSQDDVFAPNFSPSAVDANDNRADQNPNLGYLNRENLTSSDGETYGRTLENLTILGGEGVEKLDDWFKFTLIRTDDPDSVNYDDFEIRLKIDQIGEIYPDLDLYVYQVVPYDPTIPFAESYAAGEYSLRRVAQKTGTGSEEIIAYADFNKFADDISYGDSLYGETYFVQVVGYGNAHGTYSLDFANFTAPIDFPPPAADEYFREESVKTINSVATLDWSVNRADLEAGLSNPRQWANQYVEQTIVQYKKSDSDSWIDVPAENVDGATCKIAGLEPNCGYDFRLIAINAGKDGDLTSVSQTVSVQTADFMNETVYRAVVVGVADYPGSAADLISAANDANAFAEALKADPQWVASNITVLTDAAATRAAVRAALANVAAESDDNDVFVFYFAGSGMSQISGGQRTGYLKTYGESATQYVSNADLTAWVSEIAAGSKHFLLDAGQIANGAYETTADYDVFINSLVNSKINGQSQRPAQTTVMTSGATGQVSTTSLGSRSDFNRAVVDAIEAYASEADSDGRVSLAEIAGFVGKSGSYQSREIAPLLVSNGDADGAILTNGAWNETGYYEVKEDGTEEWVDQSVFAELWAENGAIVVTTTVDSLDKHDGKTSLREAIEIAKQTPTNPIEIQSDAQNGERYTFLLDTVATFGTRSGKLLGDVAAVYQNGVFKTTEKCSIEDEQGRVFEIQAGATVDWTDVAQIRMTDAKGVKVSNVQYAKYATYGSGVSENDKFKTSVKLDASTVLKTTNDATAKDVRMTFNPTTGRYELLCEGREYKANYAYLDGVRVELSDCAEVTRGYVFNRIVVDESLSGQAFTLDPSQKAIVVDYGVVIDASATKGTVAFDGQGGSSLLQIAPNANGDWVTAIGFKIVGVQGGAAIEVLEGAKFELANSLVANNDGGAQAVVSNAGETSIVNVTFANNASQKAVVSNASGATLEIYNSLFGLNGGAQAVVDANGAFQLDGSNFDGATKDDFVDAANGDYRLTGSKSEAADRGDSTKLRLNSGDLLEYDLNGETRVSYGSVDAGAYEYVVSSENQEKPSTVVTIFGDVVDPEDGEISLREAIAYAGSEYETETELQNGEIVVAANGFQYEVRNGKFVAFQGVSGSESGVFYNTTGVYLIDARGVATLLADGANVVVASGSTATVSNGKLVAANGETVAQGEAIRFENAATSATGTLAYAVSNSFTPGQKFFATLAADAEGIVWETAPTFDAGEYEVTANADGTFSAVVNVTTTENNQETVTQTTLTFGLAEGFEIAFRPEGGEATTATIATTRTAKLQDGEYVLTKTLYDVVAGETIELYRAGTKLTLTNGVFTDADGATVRLPVGTELLTPNNTLVKFAASASFEFVPQAGETLTLADGTERKFKSGTTVYETVRLGTTITFADALKTADKTIELQKGAISVSRPITLDASSLGGLTIDAGGATAVFAINSYRFETAGDYVVLANLTLQNGAGADGGLIYVTKNSNVRVDNSTLQNATAENGGAVYNEGRLVLGAGTTISGVSATIDGGAIYNAQTGTATVECAISNASATNGGAVYNVGTISLNGATIADATAENGGAIYNEGTLSLTKNAAITGATATADGGAIYNVGSVVANGTTISGATAENGAAIYSVGADARVSLIGATLTDNVAANVGGAVYTTAPFFANRTVFAANSAADGSAISVDGTAAATIINSRFHQNAGDFALTAAENASLFLNGVTIYGNENGGVLSDGATTIYNSIIGGNVGDDVDGSGSFDIRYNMIEKSTQTLDATNVAVFDPAFRSVSGDDWAEWNVRLSGGSAAVDGGSLDLLYYFNFNGVKTAITIDFAGSARPNGVAPDMGAYEIANATETPSTIVTTLEDVYDPYDGLTSLREAIAYAATGNSETGRTVTFSPELFDVDPSQERVIYLTNQPSEYQDPFGGSATQEMGAIFVQGSVIVTTAYEAANGETAYRNLAIDGRGVTSLFVKVGSGDAELRGLTLRNGSATGENANGGAIVLRDGSLSVVDCYVVGNEAEKDGGAIYQEGGALFVVDSLFAENVAGRYGGAIRSEGGRAYVYNATIADNDAALYGGIMAGGSSVFTLANSIVAQNGGAQNCDVYVANGNLNATANLIGAMDKWANQNGYNGNKIGLPENPLDPLFVGGGATYGERYSLRSESLAVNTGVNAYANGPDGVRLKLDLNAQDRVVGDVVDMGAFESQYRDVPTTVVTTLVDTVDQTDGEISFREALKYSELLGTPITFKLSATVQNATIQLDPTLGAFEISSDVVVDASSVPGGVAFVGADSNLFRVLQGGDLTLINVLLTGANGNEGGAIYMNGGSLQMTNCVVYGNKAEIGGAIYVATQPNQAGASVKLLNTTIAGNEAENFPGVYFGSARGTFELQNSIIAANATETSTAVENYDLYVTGTLNATASVVGVAQDALASVLDGVNGVRVGTQDAPVDPGFTSADSFDFTLTADSIAVNQGSNRLIGQAGYYASILLSGSNVQVVKTDVLGNDRLVGGTVDIGAYEYQIASEKPSVVVTTLDDVVDPFDGKISLREAIEYAGSAYFQDCLSVKVGREIAFDSSLAGGTIKLTETLDFSKCVTIDASGLTGGLTISAGGAFGVFNIDAIADTVASEVALVGLTITGGKATSGAGVYHVGGNLTLLNCVVYGNEAQFGAGVRSDGGKLSLVNVTITKNSASNVYGGVYSLGGSVVLRNALIAKNEVNGAAAADVYISNIAEMRSTLIGIANDRVADDFDGKRGSVVGTAGAPIDPSFNDWANDDFTLARDADGFNSVAINAGDNTLTVYPNGAVAATDANVDLRFVGGTVDIGAYESELGPTEIPSLVVTTAEDVVDPYDGLISLREAVAYAGNYNLAQTITFAASINGSTLYLNKALTLNADLTIDGLANGSLGFTLTTADDVNDERIIYVNNGNAVINGLTITNRRFERLQAGLPDFEIDKGGAIYVRSGSISVYNSLIADAGATQGSALYINEANSAASAKLVNCTVVGNMALDSTQDGGAIYAPTGTLTLQNTIVAGNDSAAISGGQTATDVRLGASANVVAANSFVSYSDALYDRVAGQNGCFVGGSSFDLSAETANLFVDVDNRDYRLTDGSLATNAGNAAFINEGSFNGTFDSLDLNGERRVYYTTIDMGAFENQTAKDAPISQVVGQGITLRVTTALDVVSTTDGETSLREALSLAERMNALGFEMTIVIANNYTIRLNESCLQVNCPVEIVGNNATIDGGNANCAFLVNTSGDVEISNLIITNGAAVQGAGVQHLGGDLTLNNVLINNCEAQVAGGAVYTNSDGTLTLVNCTLAKNVAVRGAGLYATGSGELNVYNSIIATNRTTEVGASAIDFELAGVVQATANDLGDKFDGVYDVSYTLIGNAATQTNAHLVLSNGTGSQVGYGDDNSIDPNFIDASGGNFRLSPTGSPAKNAGSLEYVPAGSRDLNGVDLWGEYQISLGAYQAGRETPSTVVTTELDVVDPTDGLISLREAIQYAQRNFGDVTYGAGSGHINESAYNAENAMNNPSVYSASYSNPITFAPSLAGKTIVLQQQYRTLEDGQQIPTYSGLRFNNASYAGSVRDYMIDASALSGLGGITIDASHLTEGEWGEGENIRRSSALFSIQGYADEDNGLYYPIHLDLRNVKIVGSYDLTAVETNPYAMVSMRNCLVTGFGTGISLGDDDSNDGSLAQLYSCTFVNNRTDVFYGGVLQAHNTILNSGCVKRITDANPGYRQAYYYNSMIGGAWGDLFVDAANGNFTLGVNSRAVNMGNNTYRRTLEPIFADGEVDLNGNQRVTNGENGTIDIGCYESAYNDVPSTVVTTLEDVVDRFDGKTSIREALAIAQQTASTVTFDSTLNGQTLVLTEGPLTITSDVGFNATGANITLSADGESSIFDINVTSNTPDVADVWLTGLTLTDGFTTASGGAINIESGNVWLTDVNIYGCSAAQYGGAIYAYDSELLLANCKIGGNSAGYYGGVVNQYGRTVLQGSYIAENTGTKQNADVWGYYPANFANSKNNVIGFVKDVYLYDGVDGNKIGTQDNPIKPFTSVSTGDFTLKPEEQWRRATPAAAAAEKAFTAFDEDDFEIEFDLTTLEETAFDDDLLESLK